jgi:hypothetical protein
MSESLRQTVRLMADGWELRGRSGGRGKLPPSYQLVRGEGEDREVRAADAGLVKRLVSLRWVAEAGKEGDETLYALTASGRAEAAKPPADAT